MRHSPGFTAGGYTRALLGATIFVGAVILIGLRGANTKGEGPDAAHRTRGHVQITGPITRGAPLAGSMPTAG